MTLIHTDAADLPDELYRLVQQCADTFRQFIDIGCHAFCLSGYLHDEECVRFARWVRPILVARNPGRMPDVPVSV